MSIIDELQTWTKQYADSLEGEQRDKCEKQLLALFETEEYRKLPYHERNKGWITSSKLKDYNECPLFAHWRHNLGKTTDYDDHDYFTVGQAIDDRITLGNEFYSKQYEVVSRRTDSVKESAEVRGVTLLTGTQQKQIDSMYEEAVLHPKFPKKANKRHLVWLAFGKYPCKAEIDHDEENDFWDYKSASTLPVLHERITSGYYNIQFGFYHGGFQEKFGQKKGCYVAGMDKHTWSRSHVWYIRPDTLAEQQGFVNNLILKWSESMESGIWEPPQLNTFEGLKTLWNSPFYKQFDQAREAPITII